MAGADREELQETLRPLGLWRQRSRAFLELASALERLGGELPRSRRDLERLPGIGPYTASALMSAVYGLHEPLVDVNMARVLGRFFGLQVHARGVRDASLRMLAADLVRGDRCLSVNWAVLDMGALVCRARTPLCQQCPLRGECRFLISTPI